MASFGWLVGSGCVCIAAGGHLWDVWQVPVRSAQAVQVSAADPLVIVGDEGEGGRGTTEDSSGALRTKRGRGREGGAGQSRRVGGGGGDADAMWSPGQDRAVQSGLPAFGMRSGSGERAFAKLALRRPRALGAVSKHYTRAYVRAATRVPVAGRKRTQGVVGR